MFDFFDDSKASLFIEFEDKRIDRGLQSGTNEIPFIVSLLTLSTHDEYFVRAYGAHNRLCLGVE